MSIHQLDLGQINIIDGGSQWQCSCIGFPAQAANDYSLTQGYWLVFTIEADSEILATIDCEKACVARKTKMGCPVLSPEDLNLKQKNLQ